MSAKSTAKKGGKNFSNDPVRNFEKWKKKYDRTKKRVKGVKQAPKKKRVWESERDGIGKLVAKYDQVGIFYMIKEHVI